MLPATLPALFAHLTRRRRARRAPEPADMGTAFGMEQWLDSCTGAAEPAVTHSRRGWLPRWWRSATR